MTNAPSTSHYIIRGGIEGHERLRVLSRVHRPTSLALLERAGLRPGMTCLEVGCGSGDIAFDMARIVGPSGRVVATDIDTVKLALASEEARSLQLFNINFRCSDILADKPEPIFDLVHIRFILTHLPNPALALQNVHQALRPGGIAVIEDIDFQGYFCHPPLEAHNRYVDLHIRTVQRRGGDSCIGPRLPQLLTEAGFQSIRMNIVQPAGIEGEVKFISPITMENIADAVIAENLATREEVDKIVAELYEFANTPGTIGGTPRIIETWGTRAAST